MYPPYVFSREFYYTRFLPRGSKSTGNGTVEVDKGSESAGDGGLGEVEDEPALRRMLTAPVVCPLDKCKVGDVLDLFAPQVCCMCEGISVFLCLQSVFIYLSVSRHHTRRQVVTKLARVTELPICTVAHNMHLRYALATCAAMVHIRTIHACSRARTGFDYIRT